jgi:hypothetical protein
MRRGIPCGAKLPGPKTQIEVGSMSSEQDRRPEEMEEYVRLFHRFQQLRPDDEPEDIAVLIGLVEKGTLREEGKTFVVRGTGDDNNAQPGISN